MIAAIGVAAVAVMLTVTWALWPREEMPASSGQTLPARPVADVTEFPVCAPEWPQGTAGALSFSGHLVVWDEEADDHASLFGADVRVHERFPVRSAGDDVFQTGPVVAGDTLAWTEHLAGDDDGIARLRVARPIDGPSQQIGGDMHVRALDADGDLVVWLRRVESRKAPEGLNDQVWVHDLERAETSRIAAAAGVKTGVAVSDGLVAWSAEDLDADSEVGVWVHDTATGQTLPPIGRAARSVDISGGRVVWSGVGGDIHGYDLRTRDRFRVCSEAGRQSQARIDGDLVVWRDARRASSSERDDVAGDIYALDLATGDEVPICTKDSAQEEPRVSGDTVVWLDDRTGGWTIRGAVVHR